jgi:hypothetical protein
MASKPKPEDLIQLLQGLTEPELEVLIRVMRRAFGDAAVDAALEAAARREAAEKVREYLGSDDAAREVARIVADGLGLPAEQVPAVLKGRSRQIGPGGPERSAGQAGPDRNWGGACRRDPGLGVDHPGPLPAPPGRRRPRQTQPAAGRGAPFHGGA